MPPAPLFNSGGDINSILSLRLKQLNDVADLQSNASVFQIDGALNGKIPLGKFQCK